MAEHMKDWLGAYLDGELQGARLQAVEAHLETCEACLKELQELQALAVMFRDDELSDTFTPVERFAANLTLQLPRLPERSKPRRAGSPALWLIPVGITAVWVFVQTLFLVSGAVLFFERVGVLDGIVAWLPEGIQHTEVFTTSMNLFGSLLGQSGQEALSFLDQAYVFGRGLLTPVILQSVIVLLYWAGMLVWFLRGNRRQVAGSKLIKT